MNFHIFIYKSILIHFHFKKSDLYKLLKKKHTTLFAKEFLIKNEFLGQLYLQNNFWTIFIK